MLSLRRTRDWKDSILTGTKYGTPLREREVAGTFPMPDWSEISQPESA